MNLWIKSAVVTSVFILLLFAYNLNKIYTKTYVPEPSYLTPLTIPAPLVRKEPDPALLMKNLPSDKQPFKQAFFEIINFQGVQKNRSGQWQAIFAEKHGALIHLEPGQTREGVTVESVDANSCVVRYGSIERRFVL